MWFDPSGDRGDWRAATRHLSKVDPTLRAVIRRVGPCSLAPRRDYFVALCKAIYSQQISVAVAAVLFGRFRELFPNRRPTPPLVLQVLNGDADRIRGVGLSR